MEVDLFGTEDDKPIKEPFEDHDLFIKIESRDHPVVRVVCKNPESDTNVCTPEFCQLKEQYDMVGWEVFRVEDVAFELGPFRARVDWSDPEEPYVDLEPYTS